MRNKRNIFLVVLIFFLLFLLSFIMLFESPEINDIKDVTFEKIDNEDIYANCKIQMINKNWFDISCSFLKTEVYYNNDLIAEGVMNKQIFLNSNEKVDLPISVKLNKSQIYTSAKDLLIKDSINIVINTEGKFTWGNIPFNYKNERWIKTKEIINTIKEKVFPNEGEILESIFQNMIYLK